MAWNVGCFILYRRISTRYHGRWANAETRTLLNSSNHMLQYASAPEFGDSPAGKFAARAGIAAGVAEATGTAAGVADATGLSEMEISAQFQNCSETVTKCEHSRWY